MSYSDTTQRPRSPQRGRVGTSFAVSLSFEGLAHSYGENAAVDDFSLTVEPGQVVCLLGRSGCGKTTLLRLAAGLERPQAGRIVVDEMELTSLGRVVPPEKRGIGLMFQDYALFPHLSVLDNVRFGLKALPAAEAGQEALSALRRVGLEQYASLYPSSLSGGEQQRVALARAIAPRPSILLMDEPFSGLDRRMRDDVRDETLAILRETQATCVIVTHDPEDAMRMADRIVLMRKGKLVQVGTAFDLYHAPVDLETARFFSELNEMPGIVSRGKVVTPVGTFDSQGFVSDEEVTVCIRPQGISVTDAGEGTIGRVVRRRFLGEVEMLDIAVDGLDFPLRARNRRISGMADGQDVGVIVDPSAVLMFERKGTNSG